MGSDRGKVQSKSIRPQAKANYQAEETADSEISSNKNVIKA